MSEPSPLYEMEHAPQGTEPAPPLMTVAEAAREMGKSLHYFRTAMKAGVVGGAYRIPGVEDSWLIVRAEFTDWLYHRKPVVRDMSPKELAECIARAMATSLGEIQFGFSMERKANVAQFRQRP